MNTGQHNLRIKRREQIKKEGGKVNTSQGLNLKVFIANAFPIPDKSGFLSAKKKKIITQPNLQGYYESQIRYCL